MSEEMKNHHIDLLTINVNDHTEKKQNLTYLSWAWAWAEVIKRDVAANYVFTDFRNFGATMMVFCDVTIFGKTITAYLPVMDHKNKAIENPDSFAVNKAMMRCLAKGIALHGLGLYIYAGEDLPEDSADTAKKAPDKTSFEEKSTSGWIEAMTSASAGPIEDFRGWWKKYGADISADCGNKGATEVYSAWAAKGAELAKK